MDTSTVTIGTLRTTFFVAGDHPAPANVRADMDAILTRRLGSSLAAALPGSELDHDSSVWLLQRLDVEADVDASWEPDAVVAAVAHAIASAVGAELAGSGDGVNVLRFENRAAYLARFLLDRASGHAGQWYYRRFAGLSVLSTSAALRTALERDFGLGLEAMQHLNSTSRSNVVRALSPNDAERVLDGFATLPASVDFDVCVAAVADAWAAWGAPAHGAWARNALELFVAASGAARNGMPLARAAETLSRLADCVLKLEPTPRAGLLAAIIAADPAAAAKVATELVEFVATISSCSTVTREAVADALTATEVPTTPVPGELCATQFGGAFLLLPDLESLSVEDVPSVDNIAVLRLLVLALCLCPEAPHVVVRDELLRRLTNIPSELDMTRLVATLPAVAIAQCNEASLCVLAAFANRLPGFSGSKPDYLRKNFLGIAASVDWEDARVVVRLGRPPLHVILTIAGLMRRHYFLSWIAGIPIEVFPEA